MKIFIIIVIHAIAINSYSQNKGPITLDSLIGFWECVDGNCYYSAIEIEKVDSTHHNFTPYYPSASPSCSIEFMGDSTFVTQCQSKNTNAILEYSYNTMILKQLALGNIGDLQSQYIRIDYPTTTIPSHCVSKEETLFSCQIKGSEKILSLCSVYEGKPEEVYLQYRYGLKGKVEFEYPQARKNSLGKFKDQTERNGHNWEKSISFENFSYKYQVFLNSELTRYGHRNYYQGVRVFKNHKLAATKHCEHNTKYLDLPH